MIKMLHIKVFPSLVRMSFLFLVNLVKGNSGIKRIWTTLKAVLTLDLVKINNKGCESHSVMSDSLWPHCSLPGSFVHGILQARIQEWVPFPFSRGFSNPGIEPRSLTLQADSLPSEPPGKPKNTGMGSLSLIQGIFPTQESNQGLLHCRWILFFIYIIFKIYLLLSVLGLPCCMGFR